MRHKIIKVDSFLKQDNKKIVLCSGCYDLLHIGHIKYLQSAKTFGDLLVVSVTSDRFVNKGPGRPVFSQDLRMEAVAALSSVDYVILSDAPDVVSIINSIKPDIYVKGDEYEVIESDVTGNIKKEIDAVESYGGVVKFTHEMTFSSTNLINNFFDPLSQVTRNFIRSVPFDSKAVFNILDSISNLKVLVIGETIFDMYSFVTTTNVSSKHSVVCSKFIREETHYGGAIATARHISKFSNNVSVITTLPKIYQEELINTLPSIDFNFIDVEDKRIIIKERFLDEKGKQLFRVDKIQDDPYYEVEEELCSAIKFDQYDIIMVNDFGHGMFTKHVIDYIETNNSKFLALNVQTNSANKGFNLVTKYTKANYISIDLPEARLSLSDKLSSVDMVANKLSKRIANTLLSITHGQYGTNVFSENSSVHVPVFSTDVIDSTGAGDAYFGITSMLAYLNTSIELIGFVGNVVGALAVRIMGNRDAIDPILLRKYITTLLK